MNNKELADLIFPNAKDYTFIYNSKIKRKIKMEKKHYKKRKKLKQDIPLSLYLILWILKK